MMSCFSVFALKAQTEKQGCYDVEDNLIKTTCGERTLEFETYSAYIRTPNYPLAFGNFKQCSWHIFNPCPSEYQFVLKFDIFDLGSVANFTVVEVTNEAETVFKGSQIPSIYGSRLKVKNST